MCRQHIASDDAPLHAFPSRPAYPAWRWLAKKRPFATGGLHKRPAQCTRQVACGEETSHTKIFTVRIFPAKNPENPDARQPSCSARNNSCGPPKIARTSAMPATGCKRRRKNQREGALRSRGITCAVTACGSRAMALKRLMSFRTICLRSLTIRPSSWKRLKIRLTVSSAMPR